LQFSAGQRRPAGRLPLQSLMRRHSAAPATAVGVSLGFNKKLAEGQTSQHRCQLIEKIVGQVGRWT